EGPSELVPIAKEGEDHRGADGGTSQREHHPQEGGEAPCTVYVGSLLDGPGDGLEEAAQQERLERDRPYDVDNDEPQVRIEQAELPGLDELRDYQQHPRDHHRHQIDVEDEVLAWEVEAREGVRLGGGDGDRQ